MIRSNSIDASRWLGRVLLAGVLLVTGCDGRSTPGVTTIKVNNLEQLRAHLLARQPDVELFRPRGPFTASIKKNISISLGVGQTISADIYLAAPAGKAPLAIIVHGHGNAKEDHGGQGLHLATWGIHSLVVSLPSTGPWIRSGGSLARLAQMIRERPELIDARVDPERVMLVGHSFGASAVAVALAQNTDVAGGILLDPAGVGRTIPAYLRKIRAPIMSIGSDERVTLTRNRGFFFQYVPQNMGSISITDASHEDAQYPLDPLKTVDGGETQPDEQHQLSYVSALTSAALSIGLTDKLDYAWASYAPAIEANRMFGGARK